MTGTLVFLLCLLVFGCILFNENDWTRWIK